MRTHVNFMLFITLVAQQTFVASASEAQCALQGVHDDVSLLQSTLSVNQRLIQEARAAVKLTSEKDGEQRGLHCCCTHEEVFGKFATAEQVKVSCDIDNQDILLDPEKTVEIAPDYAQTMPVVFDRHPVGRPRCCKFKKKRCTGRVMQGSGAKYTVEEKRYKTLWDQAKTAAQQERLDANRRAAAQQERVDANRRAAGEDAPAADTSEAQCPWTECPCAYCAKYVSRFPGYGDSTSRFECIYKSDGGRTSTDAYDTMQATLEQGGYKEDKPMQAVPGFGGWSFNVMKFPATCTKTDAQITQGSRAKLIISQLPEGGSNIKHLIAAAHFEEAQRAFPIAERRKYVRKTEDIEDGCCFGCLC